jgi:hypothetical protein
MRMATATNINETAMMGSMMKAVAINLKIPSKLALPPNSRTSPHVAPARIKATKKR